MVQRRYDVATIAALGGNIALDFVNTIEDRTSDRPDDTLRTARDLVRFGVRHGLLDADARGSSAELAAAATLRSALIDVLAARVDGRTPPKRRLDVLADRVTQAWRHATLIAADGSVAPHWSPRRAATVVDRVAFEALNLLSGPDVARVKRCGNDACGWFFLDLSKNASRRWCSMRGCGTEAKSARRRRG